MACRISLTQFVDFAISQGRSRITQVRRIQKQIREGYKPASDFYKRAREGIQEFHREAQPKSFLDQLAKSQKDLKKQTAYPAVIDGYKRFLGRKNYVWFEPPRAVWTPNNDVEIVINPELGLVLDGKAFLIKLYFKGEEPSKRKLDVVTHLLHEALDEDVGGATMGVLDTRNGKLHVPTVPIDDLDILLKGEAMAFDTMWTEIAGQA